MPRRKKKTGGKLHLREELEDSVRSFAKLLDISKSHVQRYEIGDTTLPAKSIEILTQLRESIRRGTIIRDVRAEYHSAENGILQEWQKSQKKDLSFKLGALERKLTKMEEVYASGLEVLNKLSCIEFTSTGRKRQNQETWLIPLINYHLNKLDNNDLTRQTELRKRIAGIKAELSVVG